jgi:RNA recognition motif-containing protein
MSIYVGNLSYDVTSDALSEAFSAYGTVKNVHLPTDRETGRVRGFAFVEMQEDTEEKTAIEELDGAEWMGRTLKVNEAKPREERPARGNFGGRDGSSRRY